MSQVNDNHNSEVQNEINRTQSQGNKDAPENARIQQIELEVNDIQRDNEFFISQPNIYLIQCGQQREVKLINKKTKVIKSETVITEITNGKASSYLANPQNIEGKFYYLLRDSKTAIFNPTFAWRESLFNYVTLGEFSSFLTELNSLKNRAQDKIAKIIIKTQRIRYSLEYIGLILILCSIGLFAASPFVLNYTFIVLIALAPSCLFFGTILLTLGYYYYGEHYLSHIKPIDNEDNTDKINLIKKWNEQLFMRKKVYLTYPNKLNYIQINTDPEWKLEIEENKDN